MATNVKPVLLYPVCCPPYRARLNARGDDILTTTSAAARATARPASSQATALAVAVFTRWCQGVKAVPSHMP